MKRLILLLLLFCGCESVKPAVEHTWKVELVSPHGVVTETYIVRSSSTPKPDYREWGCRVHFTDIEAPIGYMVRVKLNE